MITLQQAIAAKKREAAQWAVDNLDSHVVFRTQYYAQFGVCVEVLCKTEYDQYFVNVKTFLMY